LFRPAIICLLLYPCTSLFAQNKLQERRDKNNTRDSIIFIRFACKNLFIYAVHFDKGETENPFTGPVKAATVPFLTVHGNILYNFSYRSYIDTPFAEKDIMQHLVQTNLNLLIKGKYPLHVTLSNRMSNSPFFKNSLDANFEFNRNQLLSNIKADLRSKIPDMLHMEQIKNMDLKGIGKLEEIKALHDWLNSPARAQELIEEKERQIRRPLSVVPQVLASAGDLPGFPKHPGKATGEIKGMISPRGKLNTTDGPVKPDTASSVYTKMSRKKEQLAELQKEGSQQLVKLNTLKKKMQDSVTQIKQEINNLKNGTELYAFMKRYHISKDSLTRAQRLLLSVNKIGVGRSWVDYSELTVKNISLTGVNIEMNPAPFYFAVAAGKLNYRFRDFILKNDRTVGEQSLYLVRAGIGQKEKNNLIFTFYNGKKDLLRNSNTNPAFALQKVLGFSAESRLAIDANNFIVAEIAKSSYLNNTFQPSSSTLVGKAFDWKTRTNEAYCIKLFSQYPQTGTRITAYYKKLGENFQSFNLYPVGTNQESWMARVNQPFFKRKLLLEAGIRKNDFTSPVAAPSFDSKTIFKSFQATLRIPKYPFVTVGFYPSSQLSLSNNNLLTENQYNTLNAVVSHSYRIKKLSMNSNAVYTKFYNGGNDTGFIYFNAASYTVTQSLFINSLTIQSSAALTDQEGLHLFTLEQMLGYQFKNKINISGSLRWSRLNRVENLFGGTAGMGFYLKKIGTVQFNYDKTYLPGVNRKLIPVDMGSMSFYREF
jgi:hypothetical protein